MAIAILLVCINVNFSFFWQPALVLFEAPVVSLPCTASFQEEEKVSDFICYNLHNKAEYLSSGRTIDYAQTIFLTTGHLCYSNRSQMMFEIKEDTVGRYDFLLTPCSADSFRIIYGHEHPHRGCFGNLCEALKGMGLVQAASPFRLIFLCM